MKTLNLNKTALVIIDLQKGIAGREGFAPYSAQDVLAKNKELVTSLKNTEALIVFVHVKNYGEEALKQKRISPSCTWANTSGFSDFVMPEAYDKDYDNVIHVAKHNWGAFYGTDLDVQLRRRGIEEIVLSGIATTIGCDTTAREAFQHGYQVIAVEDAMTDFNGSLHKGIVDGIFTRLGRVRSTQEVVKMIEESK
ncbi:isochorismatase family protein [Lactococcus cremoris]